MNLFPLRASAATTGLLVGALAAGVILTGCSAGQLSQSATQEPAVNGTNGAAGNIALRNVHMRAAQTTDYVQPGKQVELLFVAANGSPDKDDKLVSVKSDVGTVNLAGDTTVPAGGVLVVGIPDGQTQALEKVEAADAAKATVTLTKPITNGLTYQFVFKFQNNGEATVTVPISAGSMPRRGGEPTAPGGEHAESGGHAATGGH